MTMPAGRAVGMDHPWYRWSPLPFRPSWRWPNGAHVAVCPIVSLGFFEDPPAEGSVQSNWLVGGLGTRPYPNIPRWSHREYGHRVGIFRVLDALEAAGVQPTVAIDAMSAEGYPFLVDHLTARGVELVAHGIAVTRMITSQMNEDEERAYIVDSLERLRRCGIDPRGWLGPEQGESSRTPGLLAEAGIVYVCDWSNDEQPYPMTVPSSELWALPLVLEYDDAFSLGHRGMPLAAYGAMLVEGFDQLCVDGTGAGRVMAFHLRPWLMGQPLRLGVLEAFLGHVARAPGGWLASGGDIIDAARRTVLPGGDQ